MRPQAHRCKTCGKSPFKGYSHVSGFEVGCTHCDYFVGMRLTEESAIFYWNAHYGDGGDSESLRRDEHEQLPASSGS